MRRCFNHLGSPRSSWVEKGELAECIVHSRGGRTSKFHATVDAKGYPFRLEISGGQLHDSQMMDAFLNWEISPLTNVSDKAFSSAKIRQQILDEGAFTVIPSKETMPSARWRRSPSYIHSDNGPEFVAEVVRNWIVTVGTKTAYIETSSPLENGYCEGFYARFRDELLNGEVFYSLKETRIMGLS